MHLLFPETKVIGIHFAADSMGISSFKFVQWAPTTREQMGEQMFVVDGVTVKNASEG